MKTPNSILITGASSGLGAALALIYAAPDVHLFLGGRDFARLEQTADQCRAKGATATTQIQDVTDADGMAGWIRACDDTRPLDLVIANAGISVGGQKGAAETDADVRAVQAVNVNGTLNTVLPALARMRPRKRGQIAVMSSLSGFRGLPDAPAYCASKAMARSFGEGLRNALKSEGVKVNVICPGFVRTPMTARNTIPMPFLLEPEDAARRIQKGLARNQGRIAFPLGLYAPVWLLSALPACWTDWFLRPMGRRINPATSRG